jgi:hypothetical protein
LVEARTRSAFVRASLGYGFLQLVRVDLTEPDTACEVDLLDIHDADPPCYLYAQEARGLRLRRLHARDVHPDSDLVAFGGRWEADQQRGHGFCLYGDDLWLEDSLATNLNDDLLYVSGAQGVTLKNNVALNSGVRHGNSLEGISLFDLSGPAVLEGNLSLGTPTPLRMERRSPQGTVTVRGGVLAQDRHQAMSLDQGPPDAGEVLFEDTVFLGGVEQPALLQASAPHRVERSLAARVQGRGPVSLRASAWLDPGRDERPALRDFAQVEGSLVSKPRLERGGALLYLQAPDASAEVLGSTLWPGEGGALRHASTSGRSTQVERNLSLGPLLTGNASDPKPAQPDVSLGWNRALGPLWTRQPWTAAHLADTNQSAPKLAWADPAAYLVAQDDPATTAAQGQPVGVVGPFGVSNPDALPLPLRPDLWTELLPLPPSEPPNLGNNNSGNNASSNNSAANNSGPKPSDDPKPDGGPKPDEEPPEEVVPRMTRPVGASCAACGRPAPRVAAPWWALALFWAWARLRAIKF